VDLIFVFDDQLCAGGLRDESTLTAPAPAETDEASLIIAALTIRSPCEFVRIVPLSG